MAEIAKRALAIQFRQPTQEIDCFKPQSRIGVNHAYGLYRLALEGVGIAVLPDFLVNNYLRDGRLQHVIHW